MKDKIKPLKVEEIPFVIIVDDSIIDNFTELKKQEENSILTFEPGKNNIFNDKIDNENEIPELDFSEVEPGVDRGLKLYTKEDAMKIFHCEKVKATRIIKYMYNLKLATQIGREYYFSEKDLFEFYDMYRGMEVKII